MLTCIELEAAILNSSGTGKFAQLCATQNISVRFYLNAILTVQVKRQNYQKDLVSEKITNVWKMPFYKNYHLIAIL